MSSLSNFANRDYAGRKLAEYADKLRAENDSLSQEQALAQAFRDNPYLSELRRFGQADASLKKYDLYAPAPQDVEEVRLDAVERAVASLAADEDLVAEVANRVFKNARDKKALELMRSTQISQAEAIAKATEEVLKELPAGFRDAMRDGRLDIDNFELAALLSANIADQINHLEEIRARKRKAAEDAKGVSFSKDPIVRRATEIAMARGIRPDSPFYDAEIRGALMDARRGLRS